LAGIIAAKQRLSKGGKGMQETSYELGKIGGVKIRVAPSALAGTLAMWAGFVAIGAVILGLPRRAALLGGLAATALHWLSDLVHNLGHAWAAQREGHPMEAIQFWLVLAQSVYPKAEPELPPDTHIRRALGGPAASVALSFVGFVVLKLLPEHWHTARWVVRYFALENLLAFGGQAVVPLGFNDGSTILENVRKKI
jgi:hypothetical protein